MTASTLTMWRTPRLVGMPAISTGLETIVRPANVPSFPGLGTDSCVIDAQLEAQYQGKSHNLVGVTSS